MPSATDKASLVIAALTVALIGCGTSNFRGGKH